MDNILIVVGILILATALGGTQLPKLPSAPLAFAALLLLLLNPIARSAMASMLFIPLILFGVVTVAIYLAEKRYAKEGENSSKMTKLLSNSITQGIFVLATTLYFVGTFFI